MQIIETVWQLLDFNLVKIKLKKIIQSHPTTMHSKLQLIVCFPHIQIKIISYKLSKVQVKTFIVLAACFKSNAETALLHIEEFYK